ncbi:hypothetical protein Dsin_029386 [Dipteronia sinensis]|uniref:Uncharacterized protein n=1 Tax=Dipteronia sinensis TaxID=43782 RepID=A0AAD9ZSE4_9ROSI|nr:hypothetical protein Dsin_029386 [Dipteronia sinensis]
MQALLRIFYLRHYTGRVSFVPAPGYEDYGEPTSFNGDSDEKIKTQQHGYQAPDVDLENLAWRTINGPFISVWLHNVPWGGEDTMAAPDAKVTAFTLEPGPSIEDPTEEGIIDSGGEVLAMKIELIKKVTLVL